MPKTITITDVTVAELLNLLGYLSPASRNDLQSQLAPSVVVQPHPTGSIQDIARAAGFDKVIVRQWDWSAEVKVTIDTAWQGGIGTNGILVVPFIPTGPADNNNLAVMSATGYPAPNMGNALTVAISETPCCLYAPEPGTATDTSPTLQYGVGQVATYWATGKPTAVALVPGRQYYINVAGRSQISEQSPHGVSTVTPGAMGFPHCDFRFEAQKPSGH